MSIVVEVIAEYLQTNRRLVIPTFGAFMVKESGERLFSDLLRTDDGVLASLIQNRGFNEMETAVTIDRFIFEVRRNLAQYGYYRLGDLGTLRLEPDTKVLKLYPPVYGELPKQKPYIPQPIEKVEEPKEINGAKGTNEQTPKTPKTPKTPITSNASKTAVKPRKKLDLVMVVAIVILVAALVAIGYGWYVSNLAMTDDDAAMNALRVVPEQIVNE